MINRLLPSLCSVIRLASVVLVAGAGLSVSAQAQMQCATNSIPGLARAEGFAEQLGDIVIDCTGGVPTQAGVPVQGVNIAVNLDTFMSSKVTTVVNGNIEFLESLLIIDEPNTIQNPTVPIRNCGASSEDTTAGGPGECLLLGQVAANAANQYNGACTDPVITSPTYNCHPNVFQGKSIVLVTGQTNQVLFTHVPIDPPGTICPNQLTQPVCHRILRITGIRGDATEQGVTAGNQTSSINAQVIVNPPPGLPIGDPTQVVARVQIGLLGPFLGTGSVSVIEGFNNAFKPRSLTQVLANGFAKPFYSYSGTPNAIQGINHNQNVPGAVYDTESGFTNSLSAVHGDNPINPLTGGTGAGNAFSNAGGINTGITNAGVADAGTRIAFQFDIPADASVQVPQVVQLKNVITGLVTGVMMLTSADQSGAGPFSPAATGILSGANNMAVYEILFANPGALERAEVPYILLNAPPHGTLTVNASYAPFYAPSQDVRTPSTTLPVPRFMVLSAPQTFCIPGCVLISPSSGPNSGPLGVTLTGDPVLSNAQVKLSQAGFPDILGLNTFNSDPSTLTATFALAGAAPGFRDVVVTPLSGTPFTLSQKFEIQAAPCSYVVGPLNPTIAAGGGSGDLVVTPSTSACAWGASTSTPWIALPPPSNSVTQPFTVAANPDTNPRNGTITIAGKDITVTQNGACTYSLTPPSKIFSEAGGSVSVGVTAPAGCPWSALSNTAWVSINGATSGSGSGSVTLQADSNPGGLRSGTVTIAGKTFAVSQSSLACGAADVSSQVSVTRGAFLSNFVGTNYVQQISLKNQGPAVPGPVYLVVDGLPMTGTPCVGTSCAIVPAPPLTFCQSPNGSSLVLAAPNGLASGQLVNLSLTFTPGRAARGVPPTWTTTRVFSGTPIQ